MLVIPGNESRDLNDLEIVVRGGEEWVRWGTLLHRPMETVRSLPLGATTPVAVGPEGYAEWRSIPAVTSATNVSISGGTSWRLYDSDFQLLGNGAATGQEVVPAGGPGYLVVWGTPGAAVSVKVE